MSHAPCDTIMAAMIQAASALTVEKLRSDKEALFYHAPPEGDEERKKLTIWNNVGEEFAYMLYAVEAGYALYLAQRGTAPFPEDTLD